MTLLQVDFATPEALPALPAAIEVAAYRIVLKALRNAARHSGTDGARVRLEVVEGALLVEVRDRGRTVDGWIAGVVCRRCGSGQWRWAVTSSRAAVPTAAWSKPFCRLPSARHPLRRHGRRHAPTTRGRYVSTHVDI